MGKLADLFRKNLVSALGENWGAKSAFVQKAGFARPTLERWLKGERVPDLDQLEQTAQALDLSPAALIADAEDQPWMRVPRHLLLALAQVHPDHHPIILNFLESFTVEREASKISKSLEESRDGHKKRRK